MSRGWRGRPGGGGLIVGAAGALVTLVVVVVGFFALSLWIYKGAGPPAHSGSTTTVILRKGAGVAEVGGNLQRAGVVRSAPLFMAAVQVTGAAHRLKAGEYAFPSRASLAQVIRQLRLGLIVHHRVTIPEGLSAKQVAEVLAHTDVLSGPVSPPAEGVILPETYEVIRGEPRVTVLAHMAAARERLLAALWARRKPGLPYADADQAVTLASIIEKETALDTERPRVAAVYLNRMRQGIKLEADPTVIYAVTGGLPLGHPIRESELHNPSPYNTYLYAGLPPGPIDNPGRAALAAALDPPDTKDLYFVADGTGGHVFAATLQQHQKNVARWREIEKRRADATLSGAPAPKPLEHR